MKRWLLLASLVVLTTAGCIDDGPEPAVSESGAGDATRDAPEPYRVSETLDLAGGPVDRTWQWAMSPNMTGNINLEFAPAPAAAVGPNGVCWRLEWPQGHRHGGSNCAGGNMGNVNLQIGGGALNPTTLLQSGLAPNSFTLRIWSVTPDTAEVRVRIGTFAAEAGPRPPSV